MYEIYFYRDKNGREPVAEYLTELATGKTKTAALSSTKYETTWKC